MGHRNNLRCPGSPRSTPDLPSHPTCAAANAAAAAAPNPTKVDRGGERSSSESLDELDAVSGTAREDAVDIPRLVRLLLAQSEGKCAAHKQPPRSGGKPGTMRPVPDPWPVVAADDWQVAGVETQGRHRHEWLRHHSQHRTWLFKPARAHRDRSIGEDLVEKLGSEIARLIGVPAARVELAVRAGTNGALVEDVRTPKGELHLGQVLLPEVVGDYDPDDHDQLDHDVAPIREALRRFAPPPGAGLPSWFSAFDAFTGYLVLDALIAHGDRHDRNWAVLVPRPDSLDQESLCPSFDHAASLGFTLRDSQRAGYLESGTVERWARRGKAYRFAHRRGSRWRTLVDLAEDAAALCPADTRAFWREQLLSVDADVVAETCAAAPTLSDVGQRFTTELVMVNRERLLSVLR